MVRRSFSLFLIGKTTPQGFMDNPDDFDPDGYPEVGAVREAYPACAVVPLSRMTVDETAVKNGDINHFSTSFFVRSRRVAKGSCRRASPPPAEFPDL